MLRVKKISAKELDAHILRLGKSIKKGRKALKSFHLNGRFDKSLSREGREDAILAKLIDEARAEKGEVHKKKVNQFLKKHLKKS